MVKIGAKAVSHGRYAIFPMAEVAVLRELFGRNLERVLAFGGTRRAMPAPEPWMATAIWEMSDERAMPAPSRGRATAIWEMSVQCNMMETMT